MPVIEGVGVSVKKDCVRSAKVKTFKVHIQSQSLVGDKKAIVTLARNYRVLGAPTENLARLSMVNAISQRLKDKNSIEFDPRPAEKLTSTALLAFREAAQFVGEYLSSIDMAEHFKEVILGCHQIRYKDRDGSVPFGLSYIALSPAYNKLPKEGILPLAVHELVHVLRPNISVYSQRKTQSDVPSNSHCIKSGAVYAGVKDKRLRRSPVRFKMPEEMLALAMEGVFLIADRRQVCAQKLILSFLIESRRVSAPLHMRLSVKIRYLNLKIYLLV